MYKAPGTMTGIVKKLRDLPQFVKVIIFIAVAVFFTLLLNQLNSKTGNAVKLAQEERNNYIISLLVASFVCVMIWKKKEKKK